MKKILISLCLLVAPMLSFAQLGKKAASTDPYPELGAKLEEYWLAMRGDSAQIQNAECDFLISSCKDSLVMNYVANKLYSLYKDSPVMGDESVAVHLAKEWFIPGKVRMDNPLDLTAAKMLVMFNENSLIGMDAPKISLTGTDAELYDIPVPGKFNVLYFYDTDCSTCRAETVKLVSYAASAPSDYIFNAVYTGSDEKAWRAYSEKNFSATNFRNLYDPSLESDFQRLYGVLGTPRMFLVSPDGVILGRRLDTDALRTLSANILSESGYVYGSPEVMAMYDGLFAGYGNGMGKDEILEVADYIASRTFGEGDIDNFRHLEGDLLYYLNANCTDEQCKAGTLEFIDSFILVDGVWTSPEDEASVVSLGRMLKELIQRTPAGSAVPDIQVHSTLRRKACLFRRGSKEGIHSLNSAAPGYIIFYSKGCSSCKEMLSKVDGIVKADRKVRVLLVDMDLLYEKYPEEAEAVLNSFDLSTLPFILQADSYGKVLHKYVQL